MIQMLRGPYLSIIRYDRQLLVLLLALVVILGAVYSIFLGDELKFLPDEADYFALTQNLVEKGVYSLDGTTPSAYRPPGYVWLLTPVRALGGGTVQYRIVNYMALALAFALVYLILRSHGAASGAFGVLVSAGYFVLFFLAGTLYPQTLAIVLFLGVVFIAGFRNQPAWAQLLAGILAGWLILTVSTFIVTVGIICIWLALTKRTRTAADFNDNCCSAGGVVEHEESDCPGSFCFCIDQPWGKFAAG